MEKYNQFLSETTTTSVFEKDEHKARLERLIEIVGPLIEESSAIYPQVNRYKRCTRLTQEFQEAWGKIFTESKSELPTINKKLIPNEYYIYTPDKDTRQNFSNFHKGRLLQFIKYTNNVNIQYADSKSNPSSCNCLVSYFEPYRGSMQFWTREQCLKKNIDKISYAGIGRR